MLHYRQSHVLDVITDALRVFKITHVRQATRKHVPSSENALINLFDRSDIMFDKSFRLIGSAVDNRLISNRNGALFSSMVYKVKSRLRGYVILELDKNSGKLACNYVSSSIL